MILPWKTDDTVRPRLVENYDGGHIVLNDERGSLPAVFPDLLKYRARPEVTDGQRPRRDDKVALLK